MRKRIDDLRRKRIGPGKPDWQFLNYLALDHENLPVVLTAMGFNVMCGVYQPGEVKWWDTFGPVLMVANGSLLIAIDLWTGAWRTPDHAWRGANLIELGRWRWSKSFGSAGWRIARLCGHERIPVMSRD